jgi:hypothetical protein
LARLVLTVISELGSEAGRESAAGHGESGNGSVHKPDELPKGLRPDGPGSRSRRKLACDVVAYTIVFRDEARKAFLSLDRGVRTRVQKVIGQLAETHIPARPDSL